MSTNRYIVEICSAMGTNSFTRPFITLDEANKYVAETRHEYSPTTQFQIYKLVPVMQGPEAAA